MNLLSWLLPQPRRHRPARHHVLTDELIDDSGPTAEPEERPRGCGWFDSSHDLQHGLVVREHANADTLGTELPLASWLELQLSGWRHPMAASTLRSARRA